MLISPQEYTQPKQFDITFPISKPYFCLEDLKLAFGAKEFDKQPVSKYIGQVSGRWKHIGWETPIILSEGKAVDVVLLKAEELAQYQLLRWEETLSHLL